MNYYDEEIEINRESTKEAAHISSNINLDLLKSVKEDVALHDASTSKQEESSPRLNQTKSNTNTLQKLNKDIEKPRQTPNKNNPETSESESEEDATQNEDAQPKTYNILTSDRWKNLPLAQELKDVIQNTLKYVPQTIETEYKLQAFMPDYVPSVGDVDAFLKVTCPDILDLERKKDIDEFMSGMGLSILDEPSGRQSDPSLLSMKLRSVFNNPGVTNLVTRVPTARTGKDIDKWMNEMSEIHRNQSVNRINSVDLNDDINIDTLMAEWPKEVEDALIETGCPLPEPHISVEKYLQTIAALFDIPIKEHNSSGYIKAIHVLFNLYLATTETVVYK